jgi:hypothetical protein
MFGLLKDQINLADLLLIIAVVVLIVFSLIYYTQPDNNKRVYIYKDDVLIGVYDLNKNAIIQIDEHNSVEIAKGKVLMKYADCPDKRCMRQGAGSVLPIICLPNKVVIEIRADSQKQNLVVE